MQSTTTNISPILYPITNPLGSLYHQSSWFSVSPILLVLCITNPLGSLYHQSSWFSVSPILLVLCITNPLGSLYHQSSSSLSSSCCCCCCEQQALVFIHLVALSLPLPFFSTALHCDVEEEGSGVLQEEEEGTGADDDRMMAGRQAV